MLGQVAVNPLNAVLNNPDVAMDAILALAQQYQVVPVLRAIGMALLALFALLEVYRLWLASDTAGLVVLGVKVIIVNAMIGPASPLLPLLQTVYGYFAQAGQSIVATAVGADLQQLSQLSQAFAVANHDWWWTLTHFMPIVFGELLALLYFLVLAILFALYTFAVIASRLFIVLSIVLVPLLFPLALWAPLAPQYLGKWVGTTVHAILLPVIGAIALVAALRMGALVPLQSLATCLQNNAAAFSCTGAAAGTFINGLIGSLAAIFLMFSLDGVVRSFIGAAEISTAGIIAARWAAGTPARIAGAVRAGMAARAAAAPQSTATSVIRETTTIGPAGAETTSRQRVFTVSTSRRIPQTEA